MTNRAYFEKLAHGMGLNIDVENGIYQSLATRQSWEIFQKALASTANHWIPCTEQRPKSGQKVILCRKGVLTSHMAVYRINCDSDLVDMREPADERAYWDFGCSEASMITCKDNTDPFIREGDSWMPAPAPDKHKASGKSRWRT